MDIDTWTQLTDNAGLESARMRLRGVVYDRQSAVDLITDIDADAASEPVAIGGRRHSQGGQTLLEGGIAIDLGGHRDIRIDTAARTATIGAGATWNDLHLKLAREGSGLAPLTHQSSALFSVGGSLAVNCHGRFPAQGPVATTVESMTLWTPASGEITVTEAGEPDLFGMALGGYGAGGLILDATVKLQRELELKNTVKRMPFDDYFHWVEQCIQSAKWPPLHYAWLDFSDRNLFGSVLSVSGDLRDPASINIDNPSVLDEPLIHDAPLDSALLQQAYGWIRRSDGRARDLLWEATAQLVESTLPQYQRQLNAMRAPIRFTRHDDPDTVDLLQEYFVPAQSLDEFLIAAADILRMYKVRLMSATVRYVDTDDVSTLTYARDKTTACVVLNVNLDRREAMSATAAYGPYVAWNRFLIDRALELGGSFYLPYWRCATPDQFRRAYGQHAAFAAARLAADPAKRLTNAFLEAYFP